MKKEQHISFSNDWYEKIVFLFSLMVIATQLQKIWINGAEVVSVFHVLLTLSVLLSLYLGDKKMFSVLIKIWGGLAILGGVSGIFNQVVYFLIGRVEGNVDFPSFINHLIHLGIGYTLVFKLKSSLE